MRHRRTRTVILKVSYVSGHHMTSHPCAALTGWFGCSYVTMRILGVPAEDEVCAAAQKWVRGSNDPHQALHRARLRHARQMYGTWHAWR